MGMEAADPMRTPRGQNASFNHASRYAVIAGQLFPVPLAARPHFQFLHSGPNSAYATPAYCPSGSRTFRISPTCYAVARPALRSPGLSCSASHPRVPQNGKSSGRYSGFTPLDKPSAVRRSSVGKLSNGTSVTVGGVVGQGSFLCGVPFFSVSASDRVGKAQTPRSSSRIAAALGGRWRCPLPHVVDIGVASEYPWMGRFRR